jgi:hypothetical protein
MAEHAQIWRELRMLQRQVKQLAADRDDDDKGDRKGGREDRPKRPGMARQRDADDDQARAERADD